MRIRAIVAGALVLALGFVLGMTVAREPPPKRGGAEALADFAATEGRWTFAIRSAIGGEVRVGEAQSREALGLLQFLALKARLGGKVAEVRTDHAPELAYVIECRVAPWQGGEGKSATIRMFSCHRAEVEPAGVSIPDDGEITDRLSALIHHCEKAANDSCLDNVIRLKEGVKTMVIWLHEEEKVTIEHPAQAVIDRVNTLLTDVVRDKKPLALEKVYRTGDVISLGASFFYGEKGKAPGIGVHVAGNHLEIALDWYRLSDEEMAKVQALFSDIAKEAKTR